MPIAPGPHLAFQGGRDKGILMGCLGIEDGVGELVVHGPGAITLRHKN